MRRVVGTWYRVTALMVVSATFSGLALALALHANAESDRKWCSIVGTLDESWRESPPTSPSGKNLAGDIRRLREELRCPPGAVSAK